MSQFFTRFTLSVPWREMGECLIDRITPESILNTIPTLATPFNAYYRIQSSSPEMGHPTSSSHPGFTGRQADLTRTFNRLEERLGVFPDWLCMALSRARYHLFPTRGVDMLSMSASPFTPCTSRFLRLSLIPPPPQPNATTMKNIFIIFIKRRGDLWGSCFPSSGSFLKPPAFVFNWACHSSPSNSLPFASDNWCVHGRPISTQQEFSLST